MGRIDEKVQQLYSYTLMSHTHIIRVRTDAHCRGEQFNY